MELWNAQISLLTGRAAARLMIEAGVGVLRTMPLPDPRDVARLRRVARALHLEWPDDVRYGDLLHTVDAGRSTNEAVFLQEAAVLFRAASYTSFDGEVPPEPTHAAIAAPYAHCTAPLRRLVDVHELAAEVRVRLEEADIATRTIRFVSVRLQA